MAAITIQVLEGLERGNLFEAIPTPITIGREDENGIRLNDERVSRFHAKIQEDGDRVILTDLDSTNGTRVNGHPIQMRVLQYGDQIVIGRCLLVYGSEAEIAARIEELRTIGAADGTVAVSGRDQTDPPGAVGRGMIDEVRGELFPAGPPEIPRGLSPGQNAQFSDVLNFAHERIRVVVETALQEDNTNCMRVDWTTWQKLVNLEMSLAKYLRQVAEPD